MRSSKLRPQATVKRSMSKFDKHFESRTVANSPLQQSSFVFYPEEELLRRAIAASPQTVREEAFAALDRRQGETDREERFVRVRAKRCAGCAETLAEDAANFAKTLPQSLFGNGNGEAFILPLGLFFERVETTKKMLCGTVPELDRFWEPLPFDPHRFRFVAEILNDAALATQTDELVRRAETNRKRAQTLSERIGDFCEKVIGEFYNRAGTAADMEHNGARLRFGALAGLCGELRNAALAFAAQCREKPKKTDEK